MPRWRSFVHTLALGELDIISQEGPRRQVDEPNFRVRKQEWETTRTLPTAIDLFSCALALGRVDEVRGAAEQILSSDRPELDLARDFASRILDDSSASADSNYIMEQPTESGLRNQIHEARFLLREYPHNVVLWVDMSRYYDTLGFWDQAERCIDIALRLAPANRFVLRSGSRLFVHHNKFSRAHALLSSCSGIRNDPWLLAAEIALASVRNKTSKLVKHARRMTGSAKYHPFHLSELSSALATLEVEAGNIRRCRSLVGQSLETPSENAIAQAAWIQRQFGAMSLDEQYASKLADSFEANAWNFYRRSEWNLALENSQKWLADQPFSSRPAILGSYLASVAMGSYGRAASIARAGRMANPNDFTLLNNLVFSLCKDEKCSEADEYADLVDENSLSPDDMTVWLATRGLLAFRAGNIQNGKSQYETAIRRAALAKDDLRWALASLFYIQELFLVERADALEELGKIESKCAQMMMPEVAALLARTKALASESM